MTKTCPRCGKDYEAPLYEPARLCAECRALEPPPVDLAAEAIARGPW